LSPQCSLSLSIIFEKFRRKGSVSVKAVNFFFITGDKKEAEHMSEAVIYAAERTEKPNKVRKQGLIPGVVYGKSIKSTSIKLDQRELAKTLRGHVKNSKVKVKLGNEVKNCIIKEIQRDIVNGQILHIELQAIHGDDIIKLKVPVVFQGKEKLAAKQQVLQEFNPEVKIIGKAADIPEFVSADVGDRELGEKITVRDIHISDNLKIENDENEVLAVITAIKGYSEGESSEENNGESEEKQVV